MSSVAEVLANLTFGANAALTKAFLDYCSIKKDKSKKVNNKFYTR